MWSRKCHDTGGPKLAVEEQARGRIKEQSPGEEKNKRLDMNVTIQGAEESRDWRQGHETSGFCGPWKACQSFLLPWK